MSSSGVKLHTQENTAQFVGSATTFNVKCQLAEGGVYCGASRTAC